MGSMSFAAETCGFWSGLVWSCGPALPYILGAVVVLFFATTTSHGDEAIVGSTR